MENNDILNFENQLSEPPAGFGPFISQRLINDLAYEVVKCAIEVHRHLGPGLLESVYHVCLLEELTRAGIKFRSEVQMPVIYKGKDTGKYFRVDLLIEEIITLELKAVESMIPLYSAQLLTCMNLSGKPKGLLINFNCENISKQLVSLVTDKFFKYPKE